MVSSRLDKEPPVMRYSLMVYFLFFFLNSFSQKRNSYIELQPYYRHDRYPAFTYTINAISTNRVSMQGTNFGILGSYGHGLPKNMTARIGLGYYRYSFNDINHVNSSFGEGNARVINYPYGGDVIYSTSRYWYHTLYLSGGLEKYIPLSSRIDLLVAGHLQYYSTFSQYYKVFEAITYKTHTGRGMGFGGAMQVGFVYKISRFAIAPQFILPVYDQWHEDKVFPGESNNDTRSKWFRGYGFSMGIRYELWSGK